MAKKPEYIVEDGHLYYVEHEKEFVIELDHNFTVGELLSWIEEDGFYDGEEI